jgi:putative RNase toxin 11 of polymorphic toxin system
MLTAAECYQKWVQEPQQLLEFMARYANDPNASDIVFPYALRRAHQLLLDGKITAVKRKSVKGAGEEIQAVLKECTFNDQIERDVAMWYGYCNHDSHGASLCLKIFAAMKHFGVFYRAADGSWSDFGADFPSAPVASLLSHGGRILLLLPMSNSAARVVGNTIGAILKGVTVDPLVALGNRGTYHTLRGKSTAGAVATHVLLRVTGVSSAAAVLSTPHKAYSAGDDRFWTFMTNNDLHDRAFATHSTIQTDWANPPALPKNRHLWFTEEKAGGVSNVRDAMMGRHYYKNVALGGVGNFNPFSGVKIDKDGSHGHLYVNYRSPQYKRFGCILLGVEGSAPGMDNQYGKVHDANAIKGEFSATGGRKWTSLVPGLFYESRDASDVTVFVCDLSHRHTSAAQGDIGLTDMRPSTLSDGISPVVAADWTEVRRRLLA